MIEDVIIERLDNLKEQNDKDHAEMKLRVDTGFAKMNGRVRTLEKWAWALTGIVAFISFCATVYAAIKH